MKALWESYRRRYILFFIKAVLLALFLPRYAEMRDGPVDNASRTGIEPRLPARFSNYMTPDNSLWGDAGHRERYWYWWGYWGMVRWLLRNPAYGMAWGPLAYTPSEATGYTLSGDPTIHARDNARAGWYRIESTDGAWEETRIRQIGRLPICLKTRTGWQLSDAEPGKPCLFLLSIRLMPFRK